MCVGKINEGFQGPVIIYRLGWGMGGGGGGAEDFGLNKVKFSTTAAEIPRKNKSRSRSLLEVRRIFFFLTQRNSTQFEIGRTDHV